MEYYIVEYTELPEFSWYDITLDFKERKEYSKFYSHDILYYDDNNIKLKRTFKNYYEVVHLTFKNNIVEIYHSFSTKKIKIAKAIENDIYTSKLNILPFSDHKNIHFMIFSDEL